MMSKDTHICPVRINNALKSYSHDIKVQHHFCYNIYILFFVSDWFKLQFILIHCCHSNTLFCTIKHIINVYNVLSLFYLLKKDHKMDHKFLYSQYLCLFCGKKRNERLWFLDILIFMSYSLLSFVWFPWHDLDFLLISFQAISFSFIKILKVNHQNQIVLGSYLLFFRLFFLVIHHFQILWINLF